MMQVVIGDGPRYGEVVEVFSTPDGLLPMAITLVDPLRPVLSGGERPLRDRPATASRYRLADLDDARSLPIFRVIHVGRRLVDVDDRSRCPLAPECESCGSTANLSVSTEDVGPLGAGCFTLCDDCGGPIPRLPVLAGLPEWARRAQAHCRHLGDIGLDEMSAARWPDSATGQQWWPE